VVEDDSAAGELVTCRRCGETFQAPARRPKQLDQPSRGLSAAALTVAITSFLVCPPLGFLGVPLGVVAYRTERERGKALSAIILSLLSILVTAVLAFLIRYYFKVVQEVDRSLH
jgi:lipopolysaccharide export LptBFGC system permease protein LptF